MLAAAAEHTSETDAGPRDRRDGPERLCIATRTVKPIGDLIRFVLGPDETVVPDIKRNLPGRGVWVTAARAAVETAVARNAFARSFKRPVRAPISLAGDTERLLERAALDALGIVCKAGLAEVGFTKAEAALEGGQAIGLLQAEEAAPEGARKLAAAARRGADGREGGLPVLIFKGAQLDLAFGRSNVIHAALRAGRASETLLARYRSLERFRGHEPDKLAEKCG